LSGVVNQVLKPKLENALENLEQLILDGKYIVSEVYSLWSVTYIIIGVCF
jgi:hypothetical protein